MEAFSDGVFAIAITLLILEISVPESAFEDLWRGILDQWPSYLAYATSFLTIGASGPPTTAMTATAIGESPFIYELNTWVGPTSSAATAAPGSISRASRRASGRRSPPSASTLSG